MVKIGVDYEIALKPDWDNDRGLPDEMYLISVSGECVDIILKTDYKRGAIFNLLISVHLKFSESPESKNEIASIDTTWTIDSFGNFDKDFELFIMRLQVDYDVDIYPDEEHKNFRYVMNEFVRKVVDEKAGKSIPV